LSVEDLRKKNIKMYGTKETKIPKPESNKMRRENQEGEIRNNLTTSSERVPCPQ
jgi:hypothetical protein